LTGSPADVLGNPVAEFPAPLPAMPKPPPKVVLVIPVLNEAAALEHSVGTVREFLGRTFPYPWQVTVADNGSKDGTFEIAQR
jgi:hypothetical protein